MIKIAMLATAILLGIFLMFQIPRLKILPLADCLQEEDSGVYDVNSLIDWSVVKTQVRLDACAFLVAEYFGDKDLLRNWLDHNGFQTIEPQQISQHSMKVIYGQDGPGWLISGGQSKDKIRIRLGIIDRYFVHSLSIGIELDAKFNPVKARSTLTRN